MTPMTKAAAAAAAVALAGGVGFFGTKLLQRRPGGANTPAPAVAAQAEAGAQKVVRIARWQVKYHDDRIGDVEGEALIDWDEKRATVTFNTSAAGFPGKTTVLTANDVTIDDTESFVTMTLRGTSPAAPRETPNALDGLKRVAASAGQRLAVKDVDRSFSTDIQQKAQPDGDVVRLTLGTRTFGALAGEWSYHADPITQRNAVGTGRIGTYRLLDEDEVGAKGQGFLGEQRSYEEWWPLPPEIAAAMVVEEQTAAARDRLALYPYPNFSNARSDDWNRTRTLFIVGRNLPTDRGKALQGFHFSDEDKVEWYRMDAVSTDPDLSDGKKKALDKGWMKLTQALKDDEKKVARDEFDAALLTVRLKQGVMPGPKRFDWGGSNTVAWFLQFGDAIADASVVRPVRMETQGDTTSAGVFEHTPYVFLPERVKIEIQTRAELPIASIPVRIGVKPAEAPADAVPSGATRTLQARREPGNRRIYRTDFINIVNGGTSNPSTLAVTPGDRLMATVQLDDVAFVGPPVAEAEVFLTPDQIMQRDKTVTGIGSARRATDPTTVKLWKEAVVLAWGAGRQAAQRRAPGSEAPLVRMPASVYGDLDPSFNKLPTIASYSGIPVTLADHAAMLLLRSTFLEMMRDRLAMLDGALNGSYFLDGKPQSGPDPDQVNAFREWTRPFLENPGPIVPSKEPPVGWVKYPDYLKAIEEANALKVWLQALPGAAVKSAVDALDSRQDAAGSFGKGTYFGELLVPNPGGRTGVFGGGVWPYYRTYWEARDTAFDPFFKDSRDIRMREWRLAATRSVMKQYRDGIASTIATAQAIDVADVRGLLKLTGIGFGSVAEKVIPQLMKLEDVNGRLQWAPDFPARVAVANLPTFTRAVRDAESYSDLKWKSAASIAGDLLQLHGMFIGTATALTRVAGLGLLAWQAGTEIPEQIGIRNDLDLFFGASAVLGADRLDEINARKVSIADLLEGLAGQFGLDSVWGPIRGSVAPTIKPAGSARLPFEAPLLAANEPPLAPRRVSTLASRIRRSIAEFDVLRRLAGRGPLTRQEFLSFPKEYIQAWLQDVGKGAARIEANQPVNKARVQAMANANHLAMVGNAGAPPPAAPAPKAPAPAPNAPKLPANAILVVTPPPPAGPYIPLLRQYRAQVPHVNIPAVEKTWIWIKEVVLENGKEVEKSVYYKTKSIDPDTGRPKTLGRGASSEVYELTDVLDRDTTTRDRLGRPTGEILAKVQGDTEGTVLKIGKDHLVYDKHGTVVPEVSFGNGRDQVMRIERVYNTLMSRAKGTILFPEVLEFHPDAIPPYFIQKKLKFKPGELEQVDPGLLVRETRPGSGEYIPRSWPEIERAFPREKRLAVAELYAQLGRLGLVAADLSLPNIYFKKAGGRWVAGILDIDHILPYQELLASAVPETAVSHDWMQMIARNPHDFAPSVTVDGRYMLDHPRTGWTSDPLNFMEKSLEMPYWGGNYNTPWIRYNPVQRRFMRVLIEPELIEQVFSRFRTEPRPALKTSFLDRLPPLFMPLMPETLARAA